MLRLTKYSLIKTIGLVTAVMLFPAAISELADDDYSEYMDVLKAMYFFDYFDEKKNKKGKYEVNEKFDKELQNYKNILAKKNPKYKDARVLTIKSEAKRYFKSTLKPIFPGRKFRYFGENTEFFVDTGFEANEIILEQMSSKVDTGDIKFKLDREYIMNMEMNKKRDTKKFYSKNNIHEYNKRRIANEMISDNINMVLTMVQIESQENIEKEMQSLGVKIDKDFLEKNRNEQMREVISKFEEKLIT